MNGDVGLPPAFPPREFEGPLSDYLDALYGHYCAFLHSDLRVFGKPIFGLGGDTSDGKDARFWHLITANRWRDWWNHEPDRVLSLERCALLTRSLGLLELLGVGDPCVQWWRERDGSGTRVMVTDARYSLMIVLFERRSTLLLKTQFAMQTELARRTLRSRAWCAWSAEEHGLAA